MDQRQEACKYQLISYDLKQERSDPALHCVVQEDTRLAQISGLCCFGFYVANFFLYELGDWSLCWSKRGRVIFLCSGYRFDVEQEK